MESVLLDAAGHRRSPATMPGYHQGRPPRNKGLRYPADPPTIEEIVAVMRAADDRADGARLRALIVILWRAGLRISEALALAETDLDPGRGAVLVCIKRQGRPSPRGRDGPLGLAAAPTVARGQDDAAGRTAVVRHSRSDGWSALGAIRRAEAPATNRRGGWRTPPIRAAPAPARACDRNGSRGRSARGHSAPAGARAPWDHIDLPPGHRQLGDHRHGP